MIKRLIFDVDNTLIPWLDEYNRAIDETLEELEYPHNSKLCERIDIASSNYEIDRKKYTRKGMLEFINKEIYQQTEIINLEEKYNAKFYWREVSSLEKCKPKIVFEHLNDKFNGNLIELNNEIYDENLNEDALKLLSDFLSGKLVLNSGQISLFNMYDFNIIPVELISNIYEILLGKEVQERDKAFYTPDYLVNYIIEQSIKRLLGNSKNLKVLDPSCGSRNIFSTNF